MKQMKNMNEWNELNQNKWMNSYPSIHPSTNKPTNESIPTFVPSPHHRLTAFGNQTGGASNKAPRPNKPTRSVP